MAIAIYCTFFYTSEFPPSKTRMSHIITYSYPCLNTRVEIITL